MSRALPGWILFVDARQQLRKQGLFDAAYRLEGVYKRRLQPKPGRRRRRYWYMRQAEFDRIVEDLKAEHVEKVLGLGDDVCLTCGGDGEVSGVQASYPVRCPDCQGTGERWAQR